MQEVILGTQIHLYEWGKPSTSEDDDNVQLLLVDDIIKDNDKPKELKTKMLENNKFAGANVIDRSNKFGIPGFNPDQELLNSWYADIDSDEEDDDADDDDEEGEIKPDEEPEPGRPSSTSS
jgi:hypothetical protein